jgi:hypothetical protein
MFGIEFSQSIEFRKYHNELTRELKEEPSGWSGTYYYILIPCTAHYPEVGETEEG